MRLIFVIILLVANGCQMQSISSQKHLSNTVVQSFATTNPTDPYNPMPLRVGTIGASTYHRPFCPFAKKSLATHGIAKRINYWTREDVVNSGRPADTYCVAGVFDCSNVDPDEFAASGNDPWCGANIRQENYNIEGIDEAIAGKTLCKLQGMIGVFVDKPEDCIAGSVKGSLVHCNQDACSLCEPPDDCSVSCDGCVKTTVVPLNKITAGMGDANKDGEANSEDYLYYHECFNETAKATLSCQNIFDFDKDKDVDVDDFSLFVNAYGTGNISWASANYPNAVINPTKPELPLRVGTEGSKYYHRLDCPSVNASWERHGIEKRADYFTWDQVEESGRVPDTNVCNAGTRE